MFKNIEYFFIYFLAICISFGNFLFISLTYLFSGLLILLGVSFLSSLYILIVNPLSDTLLTKIFSIL
jgi:hypothetical protein